MESRTVVTTSGQNDVTSVTLEIIPDSGYVVAARDFTAGANPDAAKIQSITLSDSETTGGPQNDGSYTASNKVNVVVDFVDSYAPTENITLDIDPSGSATPDNLIPVKLQGTFAVPASPDKVTFVASNVEDFASSASTTDFYAYENPGDLVTIMVMTIAATSNDFINEDPTISISNTSNATAEDDYDIARVDTFDSENRLTQVVYTVKATMPRLSRSGDLITFTGAGLDIPGLDKKIYAYKMNTANAGLTGINRRLEIIGDNGAQFRIKMQRGTLSGATFTVNSTDGVYVFDNSQTTIANAFEASTSTTTYPSEIQSDGSYDPATDPHTIDSTGLFFRNIVIPEDIDGIVYRFTIIPETGTTVDASAPGIDTVPDPDVIEFDILRNGFAFFTADHSSARGGLTSTIEYYDYLYESKGSVEPRGQKNSNVNVETNTYSYELIVTDDNEDFHLPNEVNSYELKEFNYAETLNDGKISVPYITASVKASDDGFYAGKISSGDPETSHAAAALLTANTDIFLDDDQRQALTDKTSFNAQSFSDSITLSGDESYLKIEFFTTDATPVYKSQTIIIEPDYDVVAGEDGQQNTTTETAPSLNRRKLYINGNNLDIHSWGSGDMTFTHNLDTFAFNSAQSSVTTLDINFDISHIISKFINSSGSAARYTSSEFSYNSDMTVSNDGGANYSSQNITTSTTHVKFTISGAFIDAQDKLPLSFDINDYVLLFRPGFGTSTELLSSQLNVPSQPSVSLESATTIYRKLTVPTFDVIVDFNNTLTSLSASNTYTLSGDIVHRLSSSYQNIGDAEEYYGGGTGGVEPSQF